MAVRLFRTDTFHHDNGLGLSLVIVASLHANFFNVIGLQCGWLRANIVAMKHAIASYREQHGLSQAAFGELVGASRWTINRIENGERTPSSALVRRVIEATHGKITANDLFQCAEVTQ